MGASVRAVRDSAWSRVPTPVKVHQLRPDFARDGPDPATAGPNLYRQGWEVLMAARDSDIVAQGRISRTLVVRARAPERESHTNGFSTCAKEHPGENERVRDCSIIR